MSLPRGVLLAALIWVADAACSLEDSCIGSVAATIMWLDKNTDLECLEQYSQAIVDSGEDGTNACHVETDPGSYLTPTWEACWTNIEYHAWGEGSVCHLGEPPEDLPDIGHLPPSNLLTMVLDTHGQEIPLPWESTDEINSTISVYAPCAPNATSNTQGPMQIFGGLVAVHGQSTASFDKKAYGIDTWDKYDVMGLPSHDKWIIKAPYADMTIVRDVLAFNISRMFNMYASRTVFFELYLVDDGHPLNEVHYRGLYVLQEKVERDKFRVDVEKNKPDEYTDGYILKVDKHESDDQTFDLNLGVCVVSYPSKEKLTESQLTYISHHMQNFEEVLFSADWLDPVVGYRSWIEFDSWVDYFLIVEMLRSVDAYWASTYFYIVNSDHGITMGPAWDYNLAFGNTGTAVDKDHEAALPSGWQYETMLKHPQRPHGISGWYSRVISDADFKAAVVRRWKEMRNTTLTDKYFNSTIQAYYEELTHRGAIDRNFEKWDTLGTITWPFPLEPHADTYEGEIAILQEWVYERAHWMDEALSDDVFLYHTWYGEGTACDPGNACDNGEVPIGLGDNACGPDTYNHNGDHRYWECPSAMTSMQGRWWEDPDYVATGGNGTTCSIQMYLSRRDSHRCPAPVHCYPETDGWPQACRLTDWIPPPPTPQPTHPPSIPPTLPSPPSIPPSTEHTPSTSSPSPVITSSPTAPSGTSSPSTFPSPGPSVPTSPSSPPSPSPLSPTIHPPPSVRPSWPTPGEATAGTAGGLFGLDRQTTIIVGSSAAAGLLILCLLICGLRSCCIGQRKDSSYIVMEDDFRPQETSQRDAAPLSSGPQDNGLQGIDRDPHSESHEDEDSDDDDEEEEEASDDIEEAALGEADFIDKGPRRGGNVAPGVQGLING